MIIKLDTNRNLYTNPRTDGTHVGEQPDRLELQDPCSPPRRASNRSSFASYLANKLSNLTSGLVQSGQSQKISSSQPFWSSAPPSPSNRWQRNQNYQQSNPQQHQSQPLTQTPILQLGLDQKSLTKQLQIIRDFNGCDFILLLDPSSGNGTGKGLGANSGAAHSGTSGSAGQALGSTLMSGPSLSGTDSFGLVGELQRPLAVHLVAPNVQEKAAWMSDISQVSSLVYHHTPMYIIHTYTHNGNWIIILLLSVMSCFHICSLASVCSYPSEFIFVYINLPPSSFRLMLLLLLSPDSPLRLVNELEIFSWISR